MAEQTLTKPGRASRTRQRRYRVTVLDRDGKRATHVEQGVSRSRLRMDYQANGHDVVEIREASKFGARRGRVSSRVLLDTTRQLAAFSEAGISILEALEMIAENCRHRVMQQVLRDMAEDIRDGETLQDAAQSHTGIFPDYYLAMLEAADRTGNLPHTFNTLMTYLERDTASKRAVKSALMYPVILVSLGVLAVLVLSTVVLPKFVDFFDDLDVELPLATRILLQMTAFVGTWWVGLVALIVGLPIVVIGLSRTTTLGWRVDRLKLRIPGIGPLLRDLALERFCRILSNLSAAGVQLPDSLRLAANAIGNRYYARAVMSTRDGVLRGEGFAGPMQDSASFPPEAVQVIRVGERTGRLTEQLRHASAFYAREVDYRLKTLTALLEPIALLIVGGAVGFVAVALVSAMYGVYSAQAVTG